MTSVKNRETELLNNMQTRVVNEYASLLNSLPVDQARKAINSGLSEIKKYHRIQQHSKGITRNNLFK